MQLRPNMPLAVVNEGEHAKQAMTIFSQGLNQIGFRYIGDAWMGGFYTSQNSAHATALVTSGAGPCLIIVVHCKNGHGALGHYAADARPEMILQGLQKMLNALPGATVDTILFAAGIVDDAQNKQLMYEMQIVARARQLARGARVIWPTQRPDDNWGAAIYLPLTGQVALFHSFPRLISGQPGPNSGLTSYNYGGTGNRQTGG